MRRINFFFISLVLFSALISAEIYSDEPNSQKNDNNSDAPAIEVDDKNKNNENIDDKNNAAENNVAENNAADKDVDVSKWATPKAEVVRSELDGWLKSSNFADDVVRQNVLSLWNNDANIGGQVGDFHVGGEAGDGINSVTKNIPDGELVLDLSLAEPTGAELFDRIIESMRRASVHVAEYLKVCDKLAWQELPYGQKLVIPQIPLHIHLGDSKSTQYLYNSLRMYLALKLVQGRFYSDAIKILEEIKPENCINPAELFITKAIIYNGLSLNEDGLEAIKDFRNVEKNGSMISRRHLELAKLLEFEMKNGKENDNNPQNISKKMDNARRILGKGDPGKEAQETEDDILKSLEKLIEKIEEQAKKQNGEAQGNSDSLKSNSPAKDSKIIGGKAPGNVDRKALDQDGGWGNLPPKEREAALSKIEREFPSHYRDIIESYFKEMANGDK
ncbi:MAG: hypothetical protein LBP59_06180 [Planctomycetaceae bacterium]|jgi:hypothetical protein|nr:hypothetical protein [Planctomycetaceae bacterium]